VIEFMTWLSVAILGPGALAVFVWFLFDLRKIFSHPPESRSE
jgi:hypothetical protein